MMTDTIAPPALHRCPNPDCVEGVVPTDDPAGGGITCTTCKGAGHVSASPLVDEMLAPPAVDVDAGELALVADQVTRADAEVDDAIAGTITPAAEQEEPTQPKPDDIVSASDPTSTSPAPVPDAPPAKTYNVPKLRLSTKEGRPLEAGFMLRTHQAHQLKEYAQACAIAVAEQVAAELRAEWKGKHDVFAQTVEQYFTLMSQRYDEKIAELNESTIDAIQRARDDGTKDRRDALGRLQGQVDDDRKRDNTLLTKTLNTLADRVAELERPWYSRLLGRRRSQTAGRGESSNG